MYLQALSDGRVSSASMDAAWAKTTMTKTGTPSKGNADYFWRSSPPPAREPFLTQIADASLFVRSSELRRVAIRCSKAVVALVIGAVCRAHPEAMQPSQPLVDLLRYVVVGYRANQIRKLRPARSRHRARGTCARVAIGMLVRRRFPPVCRKQT
jgi:hypothetical protein